MMPGSRGSGLRTPLDTGFVFPHERELLGLDVEEALVIILAVTGHRRLVRVQEVPLVPGEGDAGLGPNLRDGRVVVVVAGRRSKPAQEPIVVQDKVPEMKIILC